MSAERYRLGRKQPRQTIYIDYRTGDPEDDRMVAVAVEPTWGPHLVERLNAGAETVEALRVATERANVASSNFAAAEDELAALVAAAGFDISDGGPTIEDIEDRLVKLVTLAQRLVRLDDPTDPGGVADRQTITLTALIEQACSALGIEGDGQ